MNFFERQDAARRSSRTLIIIFVMAVACIVAAVDLVIAAAWLAAGMDSDHPFTLPRGLFVVATLGTLAVIFGVSLFKIAALRIGGGAAVAGMVGGRRVDPASRDPRERRLMNVVEEMAIAAGARVPAVYVMDGERGINAFAAGYDVSSSVICVTSGTLERLTRDELQGVIGHEFSHIVNGDMALNIRMIGVLAGIVFLGAVGEFLMRSGSDSDDKKSGAIAIAGIGLLVIGYIGLFFARLIKSSLSRQREFLADASGVQFTRNPDGLAGALDQIRGSATGSLVINRHAEDVSHLFFGQAVAMKFQGFFATHPPIDERIKRINPRFQASAYRPKRVESVEGATSESPEGASGFAGSPAAAAGGEVRAADAGQRWGKSPRESAALVGSVDDGKMEAARRLLSAIPAAVREKLRDPDAAAATVVALLLAQNETVMKSQLEAVSNAGVHRLAVAAMEVHALIRDLGPAYYLPVVDLALPALKLAGPEAQLRLLTAVQAVIHADRRVSLFEFVIFTLLRWQFAPAVAPAPPKYKSIAEVRGEVHFLLSLMAYAGGRRGADAQAMTEADFRAGAKEAGIGETTPLPRNALGLDKAGEGLAKLRDLAPMPKAVLVKALFATVTADGTIRIIEAALMRTVGAVLDCPLPPLLEESDPASFSA
ncbi:MAG TPA: M48 family metallopeptidase [Usitatibacter sp.]|nr:M48 family metallopeptidase [Usitatibacter sp.]